MQPHFMVIVLSLIVSVIGAADGAALTMQGANDTVKPLKEYRGKIEDEKLLQEASLKNMKKAVAWINKESELKQLWKAWKLREEMPKVDFKKELVIVIAPKNTQLIDVMMYAKDKLRLTVASTATVNRIPGFSYYIATINRKEFMTVNDELIQDE